MVPQQEHWVPPAAAARCSTKMQVQQPPVDVKVRVGQERELVFAEDAETAAVFDGRARSGTGGASSVLGSGGHR